MIMLCFLELALACSTHLEATRAAALKETNQ